MGSNNREYRTASIRAAADLLAKELRLGTETPRAVIESVAIKAMGFGFDDAVHQVGKMLGRE